MGFSTRTGNDTNQARGNGPLSESIVAPSDDDAICLYCSAVVIPGGNGNRIGQNGHVRLPVIVPTPSHRPAFSGQSQAGMIASGKRYAVSQVCGHIALTVIIDAPGSDGSICFQVQ